jgi:hypothetical protein
LLVSAETAAGTQEGSDTAPSGRGAKKRKAPATTASASVPAIAATAASSTSAPLANLAAPSSVDLQVNGLEFHRGFCIFFSSVVFSSSFNKLCDKIHSKRLIHKNTHVCGFFSL